MPLWAGGSEHADNPINTKNKALISAPVGWKTLTIISTPADNADKKRIHLFETQYTVLGGYHGHTFGGYAL
jgi:hypothetical protein